jgi:hypothetical protein
MPEHLLRQLGKWFVYLNHRENWVSLKHDKALLLKKLAQVLQQTGHTMGPFGVGVSL